jgi:hypothetical protein
MEKGVKVKIPMVMRPHSALILLLASSILCGCASGGAMAGTGELTIDKLSSDHADIGTIYARKSGEGIDLAGKVKFKRAVLGVPRDRLLVTVVAPTGRVLYTTYTNYYRYGKPSKKSDTFSFAMSIPVIMPKGSTVRLVNDGSL